MIKILLLTSLLNTGELQATPPEYKIEARRRGKGNKQRRRGGNGLR